MKALKNAAQHNAKLSEFYYTIEELEEFTHYPDVFKLTTFTTDYRVSLENAELKVVCKDGYYTNMVITEYGNKYYVEL